MNPDPGPLAFENSDQMIRFNPFRFLSGKKTAVACPEKTTENSVQMVNAPIGNLALTMGCRQNLDPLSGPPPFWTPFLDPLLDPLLEP